MISICIPVFNYDVTKLVTALAEQMKDLKENVELIVIDDGSEEVYKSKNRICLQEHTYIELTENIGRSRIRNLFTQHAKNQYLLFLDCDVEIVTNDFLKKYLEATKDNNFDVICGGLTYTDIVPLKTHQLRWRYGIERECRTVEERSENPYNSFMTSNFLLKKEILDKFPFDEKITQYGHEDTLLGFDLKKASKKMIHIGNPVLHADKESNKAFVLKTEKAIQNLVHILEDQTQKEFFINSIRLLCYARKIHKYKMSFLVIFFFKIIKKHVKKGLINGANTNLIYFDFYKLGVLLEYERKQSKSV